jgi:hypothetical protein
MHRIINLIAARRNAAIMKLVKKGILLSAVIVICLLLPVKSHSAGLKTLNSKGTITAKKDKEGPMPPVVVDKKTKP